MDTMKVVLSPKKKRYLLLLLISLVLAATTAVIYVFVNSRTSDGIVYDVNKYSDTTTWCDASTETKTLSVDCKGLLLNIRNTEDGNSCFDVQVITKDEELKDISVCEESDSLSYTNDILQYKKLMPVDMVFSYTKNGVLNSYVFSNVSLSKVDDTYIQNIVNEDIANLVTLDPTSTTIQNSVDFCPRPETLPNYITDENRTKYSGFFDQNTLSEEDYNYSYLYNWDDNIIRILFACDSAENMGYGTCNKNKKISIDISPESISALGKNVDFNTIMDDTEKALLKEISLIYDNTYIISKEKGLDISFIKTLFIQLNSLSSLNQNLFCSATKIYDILNNGIENSFVDESSITNTLIDNLTNINSFQCFDFLETHTNLIDKDGIIIYQHLIADKINIVDKCNFLKKYIEK